MKVHLRWTKVCLGVAKVHLRVAEIIPLLDESLSSLHGSVSPAAESMSLLDES